MIPLQFVKLHVLSVEAKCVFIKEIYESVIIPI